MTVLLWCTRGILALLGLAVLAATTLPAVSTNIWWIRSFDFARLQTLIVGVVVLGLLAASWRRWPGLLLGLLLLIASAYNAAVLWSYTPAHAASLVSASACPAGNRLRLLEVNVQMTSQHDHRLLNIVRQAKPDVAWFQETDQWWVDELASLAETMPHRVTRPKSNYYGVDLFSRFPLSTTEDQHLIDSENPAIITSVAMPSGKAFKLHAIHPRPPQRGQSTAERDAQILAMGLAARDDKIPHVTTGDFNSVPWESVVRQALRVGRFLDPRVGRGLFLTWNANSEVLKWPLDQILPGPGFTLLSLTVLPQFGSDHRPFVADLCLDEAAAGQQAPPPLRPGDLDAARRAVRVGQGKADSGRRGD